MSLSVRVFCTVETRMISPPPFEPVCVLPDSDHHKVSLHSFAVKKKRPFFLVVFLFFDPEFLYFWNSKVVRPLHLLQGGSLLSAIALGTAISRRMDKVRFEHCHLMLWFDVLLFFVLLQLVELKLTEGELVLLSLLLSSVDLCFYVALEETTCCVCSKSTMLKKCIRLYLAFFSSFFPHLSVFKCEGRSWL